MDLTIKCKIRFTEAVFTGKYPNAKFSHEREIIGTIIKDSYGSKRGQHTFTILVHECDDRSIDVNSKIRRKGRNVYKNCVVLEYPEDHDKLADEKHERADAVKGSIKMNRAFDKGDHTAFENHNKFFKYN